MLYHLQPSDEMTGGPWYTDNELDTEFIKLLCSACVRFIRDRVRLSLSFTSSPSAFLLRPSPDTNSHPHSHPSRAPQSKNTPI